MANKNHYICIALNDDTLKIVEVKGSSTSAKVTQCVAQDITGLQETQLSGVIQKALKGFSVKAAPVVLMVPPSMTTSKNIEIPSIDEEEIKSIVNLQASRHTPFTKEEIQVGFVNIGVFKNNYTKVLLVIANRLQINTQISAIEGAGVKVRKVLFAPEAIAHFFGNIKQVRQQSAPVGLIDVTKNTTNFLIISNGKAVTYRNILVGRNQLSQDPGNKDKLIDELKNTLEAYQSEDIDQMPAGYVFSSADEYTSDLQAYFKEKLNWEVGVLPFLNQTKTTGAVLKKMNTQYAANSFLDVIATASSADAMRINLVPAEVQLQKSIEEQGKDMFKAASLTLVLIILVACIFGVKIHFLGSRLEKLSADYETSKSQVEELETQSRVSKTIRGYLDSRMISLDAIRELYQHIPKDVYITRITMEESGDISLQGVSEIGSTVYNLNTKLKDSTFFSGADVKSKKAKKDRGKDAHAFEIVLKINDDN